MAECQLVCVGVKDERGQREQQSDNMETVRRMRRWTDRKMEVMVKENITTEREVRKYVSGEENDMFEKKL